MYISAFKKTHLLNQNQINEILEFTGHTLYEVIEVLLHLH